MPKETIAIVARRSSDRCIGYDGDLPWILPEDMKHFAKTTTAKPSICVMGRKTYDSIGGGYLKYRTIFVLTNDLTKTSSFPSVKFFRRPEVMWEEIERSEAERVFLCGGEMIYNQFIDKCDRVILTEVLSPVDVSGKEFEGKPEHAFFTDSLLEGFEEEVSQRSEIKFSRVRDVPYFFKYYRRIHPEHQYMDIARKILAEGASKMDRTETGTLSMFGPQMTFDLREGFPLLTTKRVFWRGVVEELFWFISGDTDSNHLSKLGIKIWEGNTSREFLDKRGLKWKEGDIGPGYGFQWRHWGATYHGCDHNYAGKDVETKSGKDQLSEVLDKIRNDPESRRIIVSAWNVADLDSMALPPCHILFQYNVEGRFLDLKMYQRSGDWFLGVPFNIASYALLLSITAHLTGKTPRKLIMTYGDAHIYSNHVDQMREQLTRFPHPLPKLMIGNRCQRDWKDIVPGDIILTGYRHHPPIKANMAI